MLSVNRRDIAIVTVQNVDYCCIIHNISKSETINLLKNSVLEDNGYIYKKKKKYCLKFQSIQSSFFHIFYLVYIKWMIVWTSISL